MDHPDFEFSLIQHASNAHPFVTRAEAETFSSGIKESSVRGYMGYWVVQVGPRADLFAFNPTPIVNREDPCEGAVQVGRGRGGRAIWSRGGELFTSTWACHGFVKTVVSEAAILFRLEKPYPYPFGASQASV
jgi:hypothetical protein